MMDGSNSKKVINRYDNLASQAQVSDEAEKAMHDMNSRRGGVSQTFGKYLGRASMFLDVASIFMDSPNSILYTYHSIGTLSQNRAYPTNDENSPSSYYEWKWTGKPNESLREVTFFKDYEKKNGVWRGKGQVGNKQYFNKNGTQVQIN